MGEVYRARDTTSSTGTRPLLEKDRAICAFTHLGLDFRADIVAAQGFAEFFADPTGRAAEASAIDRYAVFLRVTDQIDKRWQTANSEIETSWPASFAPLACKNVSVAFVGSSEPLVPVTWNFIVSSSTPGISNLPAADGTSYTPASRNRPKRYF